MINEILESKVKTSSDINEHLLALRDLSEDCTHITELGVRGIVSTWAFLAGLKKGGKLVSIDILHPSAYGGDITEVERHAKESGIDFEFIEGDTTNMEIEKTDLLFVDTLHTYSHVKKELALHAKKVKKYIAFHDTTSCPEIWQAVQELIDEGKWKIKERYTHNNGVTILEKND